MLYSPTMTLNLNFKISEMYFFVCLQEDIFFSKSRKEHTQAYTANSICWSKNTLWQEEKICLPWGKKHTSICYILIFELKLVCNSVAGTSKDSKELSHYFEMPTTKVVLLCDPCAAILEGTPFDFSGSKKRGGPSVSLWPSSIWKSYDRREISLLRKF